MNARSRVAAARSLARLVRDAWPVLVRGYLPDLARQVPSSQERRPGHPRWCSQGHSCHPPRRHPCGTVEWDHASRVDVYGEHGAGDVFLIRMAAVRPPNGRYDVEEALVLTADGTFTADEAEAYALAILRAVRQLDRGLDDAPTDRE